MRLDKFLTEVQIGSRSQVKDYIKKGRIRSFIASLRSKLPNIGNAIEVTAAITELINFAQGIIK